MTSSNEAKTPLANVSSPKDNLESADLSLLLAVLQIDASSADAMAYQMERYHDISREVMVVTLRRFAKTFRSVSAAIKWHPIATAPKDGTEILLAHGNSMWIDYWTMVNKLGFWARCDQWDTPEVPSHWMPLPSLPITQAGASPQERNSREVFDAGFCSHQTESELAKIQQKQDGRRAETDKDAEYIADIDTLLGIIDSLKAERSTLWNIARDVGADNMKAAILQRVREKSKRERNMIRAETLAVMATELEDIEVNDLEVK